jgi:hypothetical protein
MDSNNSNDKNNWLPIILADMVGGKERLTSLLIEALTEKLQKEQQQQQRQEEQREKAIFLAILQAAAGRGNASAPTTTQSASGDAAAMIQHLQVNRPANSATSRRSAAKATNTTPGWDPATYTRTELLEDIAVVMEAAAKVRQEYHQAEQQKQTIQVLLGGGRPQLHGGTAPESTIGASSDDNDDGQLLQSVSEDAAARQAIASFKQVLETKLPPEKVPPVASTHRKQTPNLQLEQRNNKLLLEDSGWTLEQGLLYMALSFQQEGYPPSQLSTKTNSPPVASSGSSLLDKTMETLPRRQVATDARLCSSTAGTDSIAALLQNGGLGGLKSLLAATKDKTAAAAATTSSGPAATSVKLTPELLQHIILNPQQQQPLQGTTTSAAASVSSVPVPGTLQARNDRPPPISHSPLAIRNTANAQPAVSATTTVATTTPASPQETPPTDPTVPITAAAAAGSPPAASYRVKRGRTGSFPQKLHNLLTDLEKQGREGKLPPIVYCTSINPLDYCQFCLA